MTSGDHHDHHCECGHVQSGDDKTTPSAACLLLINIGNSRVAVSAYEEEARAAAAYFAFDDLTEAVGEIKRVWDSFPSGAKRFAVFASVNPPRLAELREACAQLGIAPVMVIGEDIEPPISADVLEPDKVGKDRLCAAAAAFAKIKGACVVADFGTAATIDLVADDGVFLGGTIIPGISLCAEALHEHTAMLPLVDVGRPTQILGKDTASAIRNGIFAMMAGGLREITERYATDIGKWPPLIVTGGDAEAIAQACDFVDRIAPDLVLDGMVIAWQKACESGLSHLNYSN